MDFKKLFHLSLKPLSVFSLLLILHSPTAFSDDGEANASAIGSGLLKSLLNGLGLNRDKAQEAYRPPFAPDPTVLNGHPRNNEIINNVNSMTSGFLNPKFSIEGSLMNFSTDCFRPNSVEIFGGLGSMQLCNKSGIYREDYMRPDIDLTKRSPEFYMLRLDPSNVANYCSCVRSRGARYNFSGPVNSEENMKKRTKLIDNLLKTGMDKLARRFNAIAPDVMYALTSMEMSVLHLSEENIRDEAGARKLYTQKSALNACAPGQFGSLMYGMIRKDGEQGALCTMAGAKRLGQGFVSGKSHDCEGDNANEPHCQDRSSRGLLLHTEIDPHVAIREIGNYISGTGALESTEKFLNRHHAILKSRGRLEDSNIHPVYNHEEVVQLRRERYERWKKHKESAKDLSKNKENRKSGWNNENTEFIQNALFNEISDEGRELWRENNAPIMKALELYKINGDISEDQITSNLDYFREHIAHNPYLAKHFPGIQGRSEKDLKKDVIKYVKEELAPVFDYVRRGSDSKESMEEIFAKEEVLDEINAAMFLTYKDQYQKTVQECEDIQKTLISLCQAATNYGPRVERISDFFTDPHLIELYQEYDKDAYSGNGDYQADDMVTATGMFCHELNPAERIQEVNQESLARQHMLNETPFLAGVRDLRKFLANIGAEPDKVWKDHRQEYQRKESGGTGTPAKVASNDQEVFMELKVYGTGDSTNNAYIRPTSTASRKELADKKDVAKINETNIFESGEIPKAIPVNEDDLQPIKVKSAAVEANAQEVKTEAPPTIRADLLPTNNTNSSFADKFSNITPLNQEQGVFDAENEPSQENSSASIEGQEQSVDPIQAELLSQLERMRAREQEMAQQIAELKNTMEEEEDQRMVEKYEQEQAALRQKVDSLTTQLNERKIEQEKPKVTTAPSQGFDGTLGGSRGRSSTASAPRVQPTSGANSQQASAPSAPASVPQNINRSATPSSFAGGTNLAAGNLGLTSQTVQSSAARSSGQRTQMGSIVSVDTNLASIARSVEGNTALRQTADPQILEKIIFKEVDGEIVFENGEPVIERTELLTLEEAKLLEEQEALAQAELLEEETNERAPASIEEEMEEIEQSLYPRSRTYTVEELADELRRGKSLQEE